MKLIAALAGFTDDCSKHHPSSNPPTYRLVFELENTLGYVVYKDFGASERPWTVKYWDVESFDDVVAHWSTRIPFEPTVHQVDLARHRIRQAALAVFGDEPYTTSVPRSHRS